MQTDKRNIGYRRVSFQEIPLLVDYRIKFLLELQGEQKREKEIVLRDELTDYFEVSLRDNSFIAWVGRGQFQTCWVWRHGNPKDSR